MIIIGLDPRVKKLMTEFFSDKVCCKCKERAERFIDGKYTCHKCTTGAFAPKPKPLECATGTRRASHFTPNGDKFWE